MSTFAQALSNPFTVAILVLGSVFGGNRLWKLIQAWKVERDERAQTANAAIENLACAINQAVSQLVDSMDKHEIRMQAVEKLLKDAALNSEKILAGSLKACEAIATETAQHRASVEAFSKNLFGEPGAAHDRAKDMLEIPSDRDKDKHFREMEYRAAGSTDTEARDLAEQDLAHTESIYPSS